MTENIYYWSDETEVISDVLSLIDQEENLPECEDASAVSPFVFQVGQIDFDTFYGSDECSDFTLPSQGNETLFYNSFLELSKKYTSTSPATALDLFWSIVDENLLPSLPFAALSPGIQELILGDPEGYQDHLDFFETGAEIWTDWNPSMDFSVADLRVASFQTRFFSSLPSIQSLFFQLEGLSLKSRTRIENPADNDPPTFKLLAQIIQEHLSKNETSFTLTWFDWVNRVDQWNQTTDLSDTINAYESWGVLQRIWSENSWFFEWSINTELGIAGWMMKWTGPKAALPWLATRIDLAKDDRIITSNSLQAYLKNPTAFETPSFVDEDFGDCRDEDLLFQLRSFSQSGLVTANQGYQVNLVPVLVSMEVKKGATVSVSSSIQDGVFSFDSGNPLLTSQGIFFKLGFPGMSADMELKEVSRRQGRLVGTIHLHAADQGLLRSIQKVVIDGFEWIFYDSPWYDYVGLDFTQLAYEKTKKADPQLASLFFEERKGRIYVKPSVSDADLSTLVTLVLNLPDREPELITKTSRFLFKKFKQQVSISQYSNVTFDTSVDHIDLRISDLGKTNEYFHVNDLHIKEGIIETHGTFPEIIARGILPIHLEGSVIGSDGGLHPLDINLEVKFYADYASKRIRFVLSGPLPFAFFGVQGESQTELVLDAAFPETGLENFDLASLLQAIPIQLHASLAQQSGEWAQINLHGVVDFKDQVSGNLFSSLHVSTPDLNIDFENLSLAATENGVVSSIKDLEGFIYFLKLASHQGALSVVKDPEGKIHVKVREGWEGGFSNTQVQAIFNSGEIIIEPDFDHHRAKVTFDHVLADVRDARVQLEDGNLKAVSSLSINGSYTVTGVDSLKDIFLPEKWKDLEAHAQVTVANSRVNFLLGEVNVTSTLTGFSSFDGPMVIKPSENNPPEVDLEQVGLHDIGNAIVSYETQHLHDEDQNAPASEGPREKFNFSWMLTHHLDDAIFLSQQVQDAGAGFRGLSLVMPNGTPTLKRDRTYLKAQLNDLFNLYLEPETRIDEGSTIEVKDGQINTLHLLLNRSVYVGPIRVDGLELVTRNCLKQRMRNDMRGEVARITLFDDTEIILKVVNAHLEGKNASQILSAIREKVRAGQIRILEIDGTSAKSLDEDEKETLLDKLLYTEWKNLDLIPSSEIVELTWEGGRQALVEIKYASLAGKSDAARQEYFKKIFSTADWIKNPRLKLLEMDGIAIEQIRPEIAFENLRLTLVTEEIENLSVENVSGGNPYDEIISLELVNGYTTKILLSGYAFSARSAEEQKEILKAVVNDEGRPSTVYHILEINGVKANQIDEEFVVNQFVKDVSALQLSENKVLPTSEKVFMEFAGGKRAVLLVENHNLAHIQNESQRKKILAELLTQGKFTVISYDGHAFEPYAADEKETIRQTIQDSQLTRHTLDIENIYLKGRHDLVVKTCLGDINILRLLPGLNSCQFYDYLEKTFGMKLPRNSVPLEVDQFVLFMGELMKWIEKNNAGKKSAQAFPLSLHIEPDAYFHVEGQAFLQEGKADFNGFELEVTPDEDRESFGFSLDVAPHINGDDFHPEIHGLFAPNPQEQIEGVKLVSNFPVETTLTVNQLSLVKLDYWKPDWNVSFIRGDIEFEEFVNTNANGEEIFHIRSDGRIKGDARFDGYRDEGGSHIHSHFDFYPLRPDQDPNEVAAIMGPGSVEFTSGEADAQRIGQAQWENMTINGGVIDVTARHKGEIEAMDVNLDLSHTSHPEVGDALVLNMGSSGQLVFNVLDGTHVTLEAVQHPGEDYPRIDYTGMVVAEMRWPFDSRLAEFMAKGVGIKGFDLGLQIGRDSKIRLEGPANIFLHGPESGIKKWALEDFSNPQLNVMIDGPIVVPVTNEEGQKAYFKMDHMTISLKDFSILMLGKEGSKKETPRLESLSLEQVMAFGMVYGSFPYQLHEIAPMPAAGAPWEMQLGETTIVGDPRHSLELTEMHGTYEDFDLVVQNEDGDALFHLNSSGSLAKGGVLSGQWHIDYRVFNILGGLMMGRYEGELSLVNSGE